MIQVLLFFLKIKQVYVTNYVAGTFLSFFTFLIPNIKYRRCLIMSCSIRFQHVNQNLFNNINKLKLLIAARFLPLVSIIPSSISFGT